MRDAQLGPENSADSATCAWIGRKSPRVATANKTRWCVFIFVNLISAAEFVCKEFVNWKWIRDW